MSNVPLTVESPKDQPDKDSDRTKVPRQGRYKYNVDVTCFHDVHVNRTRFFVDTDRQVFELGTDNRFV